MQKILPILSDSLRVVLNKIVIEHDNQIAKDILNVDRLVIIYNNKFQDDSTSIKSLKELFDYINILITDEVRAITIRTNVFEVSFTPKGKELKYSESGVWSRDGRQTGKPARIFKKLLRKSYKSIELEYFNNLLKAEIMNIGDFKIVEGSDITKYYNEDLYFKQNASLGCSCMKHPECSDYFNIYEDCAKMLICIKNDLIVGRAILWKVDNNIIMDRVYVCDDYLEEQFIDYAKDHKWIIREFNKLLKDGEQATWLHPDDNYTLPIMYNFNIQCKQTYKKFPYVDSFRYYNFETNTISTNPSNADARLSSTQGDYYVCKYYTCANCGKIIREWDDDDDPTPLYRCNYLNEYYCTDCCEYNDVISDYISIDAELIDVYYDKSYIYKIPKEFVFQNLINIYQFSIGRNKFIKYNNKYYSLNYFTWNLEQNKYIFNET